MLFLRSCVVVLAVVVLAARAASAPEPFPGVDDKWHYYRSPNCELFSRVGDKESRALLFQLEQLQALFAQAISSQQRRFTPISIYYFSSPKTFLPYVQESMRSEERTAGYHFANADRSVVALSPAWDEEYSRRLIYHEFIHHVTSLTGEDPALWYREGIAEVFSTFAEEARGLVVGRPIPEHVQLLSRSRPIPLPVLFAADHGSGSYNERNRVGMFYAQSWAVLHYWYFGDLKLTPDQQKARERFFTYVRNEGDKGNAEVRRQLFEQAMGKTYEQMLDDLDRYFRSGRYRWTAFKHPDIPPASSYERRPMSRDEIRDRLAELDLRVNRAPKARLQLLHAAEREPADPRSLEALGTDYYYQGDLERARERWRQALTAGSKNPAIYYELMQIEWHRWFERFDYYFRMPDETAEELRALALESLAVAPRQAFAYELLAWVEASAVNPVLANVNTVQENVASVASPLRTLLALAMLRLRVDDLPTASKLLDAIERHPKGAEFSGPCQTLRERIEKRAAGL
ncbi:MAG: hypothetical protein NVV63_17355 [Opitutus sp.]|nr:hypothetical protein [Opitutus sp.]